MRKLLKLNIILSVVVMVFACSSENNEGTPLDHQAEISNEQIIEKLNSRLGVKTLDLGNGNFEFTYPDGRSLILANKNGNYFINGTRINNQTILIALQDNSKPITERLEFTDASNGTLLGKKQFISMVNDYSKLSAGSSLVMRPCNQHPSNESFDDCFSREWDEFCDGFLGCVAQATNPVIIAAVIAGHCAAC